MASQQKYQKYTHLEHIKKLPDTYVGSSISTGDEGFLYLAKNNNIKTIEINPKQTVYSHLFDLSIRRTAKDVLGILADFSLLLEN